MGRTLDSSTSGATNGSNASPYGMDDPFAAVLAPPPDETPVQRVERERREAEAKRVNDEIDDMLRAERTAAQRRRRKPVKVLLLGQSESGKSTTLKNFQLTYARKAWAEERASWRAVIQLNLVRSVTLILDLLHSELTGAPLPAALSAYATSVADEEAEDGSSPVMTNSDKGKGKEDPALALTEKHKLLKLRLAPLRRVQRDLELRLGSGSEEPVPYDGIGTGAAAFEGSSYSYPPAAVTSAPTSPTRRPQEFYVRSSTGWKSALEKLRGARSSTSSREEESDRLKSKREREADETTAIISGLASDISALWSDGNVRALLTRRGVKLEESGGFFLDSVTRVAARDYTPSDDDVIRARLRTMGVQEYRFLFERGAESGAEWLMYDVGGTRTLRQAWAPFFDDVNAVIFLAPISCFDEKLAEDRRVNRLEDSFLLWKAVCGNKLLAKTQLILFLNKCDLLERKLRAGIRVKDYVPSFGERGNTMGVVAKYFRQKFHDMSKQYSPEPRPFYVHLTSVIDTKATAITLGAVREGILREHLRGADFL